MDRAALEWALAHGVPHGGWCPKNRRAEDGVIPPRFRLRQTGSRDYSVRTRRNARDSTGTVIFSETARLSGGTRETAAAAKQFGKPLLRLVRSAGIEGAAAGLKSFVKKHGIAVLNVAGPRASEAPGLGPFVKAVLSRGLKTSV